MTYGSVWDFVQQLVEGLGLTLFDIEVPAKGSGVLRVFIDRPVQTGSVAEPRQAQASAAEDSPTSTERIKVEDCVRVSKAISNHPAVEEYIPGEVTIEVSSPGINRRLKRAEHFVGAVGERVRITFEQQKVLAESSNSSASRELGRRTVTGTILACQRESEGVVISISPEEAKAAKLGSNRKGSKKTTVASARQLARPALDGAPESSLGSVLRIPLDAVCQAQVDFRFT